MVMMKNGTETMVEMKADDEICKLRSEIASLKGQLEGVRAWDRDPVWRRTLLETLLLVEGFSSRQVYKIMFKMKRENQNDESQLRGHEDDQSGKL